MQQADEPVSPYIRSGHKGVPIAPHLQLSDSLHGQGGGRKQLRNERHGTGAGKPRLSCLAAKCGYGVSTVKRALDELVKAGYIVKQARFDERKNGGQTSNLYTLCSDLLCPDEPENAPVLEDDASDESPAVQPESAPADACNASDPTPGEQSATLPTADSYSFADGFETKIGRQFCRPIRMWTGGQSIFIPP